jgi:hypothetical protein
LNWSDEFEDPISGFRTLHDAANYIQKLPKVTQQLPHWQAAVEALIMAAEGKGPLLHARVGMLRAMNHGREKGVIRSQRDALGQAEAEADEWKRQPTEALANANATELEIDAWWRPLELDIAIPQFR